jgi:hypothetical protein
MGLMDLKKVDIWNNLPRASEHWEYNIAIDYTCEHPDALSEYHEKLPRFYRRAHGCMSNEELDIAVYGSRIDISA